MSDWNDLTCRGVQNKQFTETFRLNLTHLPSFTFTGQVDIKVKDLRGTTLKTWSSVGTSPAITTSGASFTITDNAGFANYGNFDGEVVETIAGVRIARAFIRFLIAKEITNA